MATPRQIAVVTPYKKTGTGGPRCKVELASGQVVPLHELTRPELCQAATMVFPNIPGNAWLKLQSDKVRDLVRENDAAKAEVVIADVKARRAAEERNRYQQQKGGQLTEQQLVEAIGEQGLFGDRKVIPEVKPVTVGQAQDLGKAQRLTGGPEQQLVEAIRNLAGKGVDLDEVREIVAEEVKRQVVEIGVTTIEIKLPDHKVELPQLSHKALPEVVAIMAAGLNLFLVGPAGSGKSTLAHQAADVLGIPFYALSLGPTTPTSKLFGYMDVQGRYVRTPFREAYENGGVILLDELDNGHPGLVAEINQATANGYCAFADGMVQRHKDTRIVATGNTFGRGPDRLFVGRNILDAATLDRFVTSEILIDERLESRLARGYVTDENKSQIEDWIGYVQQVRRKVESLKLPVVVSPRATIEGAKLLAHGLDVERVKEIRLFAGIGEEVRQKIR